MADLSHDMMTSPQRRWATSQLWQRTSNPESSPGNHVQSRKWSISQAQQSEDVYTLLQDDGTERHLPQRSSSLPRPLPEIWASDGKCHLLELPYELRELIFSHAVVEWKPQLELGMDDASIDLKMLERRPIRMDRFNRPPLPALTLVSRQIRKESMHLYYQLNEFECWRPLYWLKDWSQSTFIDWLCSLPPKHRACLSSIVLLYKHESELEHDIEGALAEEGFELNPGIISSKQELSEYEMCFEEMGLPRHFGKKRRWDRWRAGSAS